MFSGSGRALFISDLDCPPVFPILNIMNMTEEVKSTLRCIDWAAADEDHNPGNLSRYPTFL